MTSRTGRRSTFTPEDDALLGTAPDDVVAARLGRSKSAVILRRQQLGITAFRYHQRHAWTAEQDARLGTEKDVATARRLGISALAVGRRRRALGIRKFKRQQPPD
jgi:hypothetical protein